MSGSRYLSWEVVVCLLWEKGIVWGQMRDNIMIICYSNHVGHKLRVIRCKHCIANTGLSKCHNLYCLCFMIDLRIEELPSMVVSIPITKNEFNPQTKKNRDSHQLPLTKPNFEQLTGACIKYQYCQKFSFNRKHRLK